MFPKYFLVGMIILFSGVVFGQSETPEKKRGITLGFGLRTFLVNDEIGSNLNYQGNALSLHIQHDVIKANHARDFNFFLATPNIENEFNQNVLDGVSLSLDYHWRFRLKLQLPLQVKWYLGPYLKTTAFARTFNFDINQVEISTGDVYGTIGASSLMFKELNNDRYLSLAIQAPMLTYMINREFIGSSTREWMLPDRFADYQFRLTYADKILKAVDWIVAYQYQLVVIDRSTRVGHEGHLFETGLKFTY